jgi:hypothetical protein
MTISELIDRNILWDHHSGGAYTSRGIIEGIKGKYFLVQLGDSDLEAHRMISFDEPHLIIPHTPFKRQSDAGYTLFYGDEPKDGDENDDDDDSEVLPCCPTASELVQYLYFDADFLEGTTVVPAVMVCEQLGYKYSRVRKNLEKVASKIPWLVTYGGNHFKIVGTPKQAHRYLSSLKSGK